MTVGSRAARTPLTREPETVQWLLISIVLSVILTVVVNVVLRAFPGVGRRIARGVTERAQPSADRDRGSGRRVHVWVPWKAMLVGSLVLTIVVNLAYWLARG